MRGDDMVKANFASERDLFQKASLGGLAKQDAEPMPLLYRCGYVQFLRLLVRRHGPAYLRRPDGALLDDGDYLPGVPSLLFLSADELTPVDQKAGRVPAPTPEDDEPTEALGDEPEGGPDGPPAPLPIAPAPAIVGPVAPVTMPAPAVAKPKRKRVTGGEARALVLAALRVRPMRIQEIVEHTELGYKQVDNTLRRYRGTYFRSNDHCWEEIQNTLAVVV
jgi:hypothetical protein